MFIVTLFHRCRVLAPVLVLWVACPQVAFGEPFNDDVLPIIQRHCLKCHGNDKVHGEIDLKMAATLPLFLQRTKLIQEVLEVVEANDMPPEGEPPLKAADRAKMLAGLKMLLRESSAASKPPAIPTRRLNRLQYNYSVRDLFKLNRDVFPLPEKLMTRHDQYLNPPVTSLPSVVRAASHALTPAPGLQGVKAFPKDLRAAHGFDNQANQLTLSPLLLDAFLRLGVSIVESPDFNEANVGVWKDFFAAPAREKDTKELRRRLERFLMLAFRGELNGATLDRYVTYVERKLEAGTPFTEAMKKAAAAALSSPLFLFRAGSPSEAPGSIESQQLRLASDLSYFLWSSGPDWELLKQASDGELSDPRVLSAATRRMLNDPKIERFLDSFPAQWLQLENVLAATPDPRKQPLFHLDKTNPASLQMLLEPLLLFDAVFLEDRPIVDLLTPAFSYQSEFLTDWYGSEMKPPAVDLAEIKEENRRLEEKREHLRSALRDADQALEDLLSPIRKQLLAKRTTGNSPPIDLKPFASWEFNGNLKDDVASLDLDAHGEVKFADGMAVLNRSYLLSKPLPKAFEAKSLEVWCKVPNLDQQGGGVMGIQGPGDFFDTIVLGERKPRHWISGSNGFSRTKDFPGSQPETAANEMLHLVMVYQADGETRLYRNGEPYGMPYKHGVAKFPSKTSSVIFGLRHLPAGGNKFLQVSLDKARLYDRALSIDEVAASYRDEPFITEAELAAALNDSQKSAKAALEGKIQVARESLMNTPKNRDPNLVVRQAREAFEAKIRQQLRSQSFQRREIKDPRYGGVITNAATLSMTSGPTRTHPIARGAWIIEVIFNDPPPPPPNDVPPLNEDDGPQHLTIRERFAKHRENPDCAGCHSRLDPLGFALENFDIVGRWREKYENGRNVDASGNLMRKYDFADIVDFKKSLVQEQTRFAKAFTAHLLRFALSRELAPSDTLVIDAVVENASAEHFRLKSLIHQVVLSSAFRQDRSLPSESAGTSP